MRTLCFVVAASVLWTCSGSSVPSPDGGSGGGSGGSGAGGGSAGGSAACSPACGQGRECCGGACVNTNNDPLNCGACGVRCTGATSFCAGQCMAPDCRMDAGACGPGSTCCGNTCCGADQFCCNVEGPVGGQPPVCHAKDAGTCPQGCAPLCMSDRALKRDVRAVDDQAVLERLRTLPISSWSYTTDPGAARHLGPMAQDLDAVFSLGGDGRAYDPVDVHGISLAAIKALSARLEEQERRIVKLEAENRELRRRVSSPGSR